MSKVNHKIDFIDKLFNILSTLITIIIAIGGSLYAFFKENRLEILFIIAFLELLILIYLLLKLSKYKNNIDLEIEDENILNRELFQLFVQDKLDYFKVKISQLKKGYIRLLGKEVKDTQLSLIDYILKTQKREILTLDLTTNPSLWLTRKEYLEKNREFIEKDGIIKRILIIDENDLKSEKFKNDLIKLGELFLQYDIKLKISFLNNLNEDEIEDFIIYDTFAILVENKQASKDYKIASSTLFFDKNNYKRYKNIFSNVYKKSINFKDFIKGLQ